MDGDGDGDWGAFGEAAAEPAADDARETGTTTFENDDAPAPIAC